MNIADINGVQVLAVLALLLIPADATPSPTKVGTTGLPQFYGKYLATAVGDPQQLAVGDFNCDGVLDVLFGHPAKTGSRGELLVRYGSTYTGKMPASRGSTDVAVSGAIGGESFGIGVATADIDGDGCDDALVLSRSGSRLYVLSGDGSAWPSGFDKRINDLSAKYLDAVDGNRHRISLIGAVDGDITGDGTIDSRDGFVSLCSEPDSRCLLVPFKALGDGGDLESAALYRIDNDGVYANVTSGDVDGDGTEDLVFSRSVDDSLDDNVTIVFGPLSGSDSLQYDSGTPGDFFEAGEVDGDDVVIWDSWSTRSGFGSSLVVADVLGSGHSDLLVGAYDDDAGTVSDAGRYHLVSSESLSDYLGAVGPTAGLEIYNDTVTGSHNYSKLDVAFFAGDVKDARFGTEGAVGVGDFNGDGHPELAMGSSEYGGGSPKGVLHVVFGGDLDSHIGSEVSLAASTSTSDYYFEGGSVDELASAVLTADITGDGLDDLLVGAVGADSGGGLIYIWKGFVTDLDGDGWDSAADTDLDGIYESVDCNDRDKTVTGTRWYPDEDGDGYGSQADEVKRCEKPDGVYIDVGGDCDDADDTVNPDATEIWYDGVDQDCDGLSDYDQDVDGYDAEAYGGRDCDDEDPAFNPSQREIWYDGIDQDCDDASDYDQDGDGFDSDMHGGEDCADEDLGRHPEAAEIWYDGVDQDCDGGNDFDQDEDGYDHPSNGGGDCDDEDPFQSPAAEEVWYDGVDQDCDGLSDYDQDVDGYDGKAHGGRDCDDTDSAVNPGVSEIWYDGLDQDCDGGSDYDQDGDGYDSEDHRGQDCNDLDPTVSPDAIEVWYDDVDQDCDDHDDFDQDKDGYRSARHGGDDCNDLDPEVRPGVTDEPYDGVDQNCDGLAPDFDRDGDGFYAVEFGGTDCDDFNSSVFPGAKDIRNDSIDQDCDGEDRPGTFSCSTTPGYSLWWPVGLALVLVRRRR